MRQLLATLAVIFCLVGCQPAQPTAQPKTPAKQSPAPARSEREKAEMSPAGWPHTTKKHTGEFVHIAPDGTETALNLHDDTVALIENTLREGEPDEFSYSLQYLRHQDGKDFYELTYQDGTAMRTHSSYAYAGEEVELGEKGKHGQFKIRPLSP